MRRLVLALLLLCSCATTRNAAGHFRDPQCVRWDSARRVWGAVAAASAVLSGSGGLAAALADSGTPQRVVGWVGVGTAALAATSTFMAGDYAGTFADECEAVPSPSGATHAP